MCETLLDDRSPEPLLDDLCVLSHREDDRECKALLAGKKTADLLAERRREHRDGTLHQVNTRSPLPGIAVESRIRLDEERDIGDMNTNVVGAVVIGLDGHGVVQILSVFRINGEDALAAKVLANIELALGDTSEFMSGMKSSIRDMALTTKVWEEDT